MPQETQKPRTMPRTKIYYGYRIAQKGPEVFVENVPLSPVRSQQVFNHSPDGFEWGYLGSGPAQLALAILLDYTDDEEQSLRLYQQFKEHFMARFGETWELPSYQIEAWMNSLA